MHVGYQVKYMLFLSDLDETLILSTRFRKKNPYVRNFIKISPEGDVVSNADEWRTDSRT